MTARARPHDCEVLVIGAGAAGLAAALALARAGRSVLLLEARDRLGGRIWSRPQPGLAAPLELGAEFVHGEAPATAALIAAAGSARVELPPTHWILRGPRLQPLDDVFPRLERALAASRLLRGRDLSFADFMRRARSRALTGRTALFARMLVEGFDAADPERVSARSVTEEWTDGGGVNAPQYRPSGGYGRLVAWLSGAARAGGVKLRLQSIVSEVRWRPGQVECAGSSRGEPFAVRARRAIVTLPLGVLQAPPGTPGSVRFRPALDAKRRALAQLAAGPVMKLGLRFDAPFWERAERGRLRDASFFHASSAAFPTLWTALPERAPTLVAWAGGPRAARLAALSREAIVGQAVAAVAEIFPRARAAERLESAHFHDWSADPFARGAYSYVTVGGRTARKRLAAPLAGTLFFAGEATDDESAATVEGALRSGERAAREVLGPLHARR